MKLSELLRPDLVLTKQACSSKDELIEILVKQICGAANSPPFPPDEILSRIKTRERIGGTVFPTGLAVPHTRLAECEDFFITLGMPAEPVFHDGTQVRLMALMITSQTGGPLYLPAVALMGRLSMDADYFSRLCGAENYEDFIKIFIP